MNPYHQRQSRIDSFLKQFLDQHQSQSPGCDRLAEAIRYTLLAGGKRIRPLLVYATADSLEVDFAVVDYLAAAIEMIHAYSLIHDDLPAMDNDDLRRGQPTCHIRYDEATAILAGDALQAMAFEVLSQTPVQANRVVKLLQNLTSACGLHGMAGGQSLDLQAENRPTDIQQLERIHASKTGALLVACVTMVVTLSPAMDTHHESAYQQFATHFGMAFQIVDDILDVVGSTEQLGKPAGSDESLHKATYPSLLGLEQAQEKARYHTEQAIACLKKTERNNSSLLELTRYVLLRSN